LKHQSATHWVPIGAIRLAVAKIPEQLNEFLAATVNITNNVKWSEVIATIDPHGEWSTPSAQQCSCSWIRTDQATSNLQFSGQ